MSLLLSKTFKHLGLIGLLLLVLALHLVVIAKAPYQQGGDLLFHTWFSQEIIDTNSIPTYSPTNDNLTHYSYGSFFHLTSAAIANWSALDLASFYPIFNVLFSLIWTILIYLLLKYYLKSNFSILATAASFLLFFDSGFVYLLPRLFALILLFSTIIILLKNTKHKIADYFFLLIAIIAIWGNHIPSAPFFLGLLVLFCILGLIHTKQNKYLNYLGAIFLASGIFLLLNYTAVFTSSFPINPSDSSFQTSTNSFIALVSEIFTPAIIILSGLGFIALILSTAQKKLAFNQVILLCWLITAALFSAQEFGGYSFLPERNFMLLIIPISALVGLGAAFLINTFNSSRLSKSLIWLLLILVIIPPMITNLLSDQHAPLSDPLDPDEVIELTNIKSLLAPGKVISDPISLLYLSTLGGLTPMNSFELTNLRVADTRDWPIVSQVILGDSDQSQDFLNKNEFDYIVISHWTYQYYSLEKLQKFQDRNLFTPVYASQRSVQVPGLSEAIPYYQVFRY
ncbi:MAG: hypothetical protein V1853_02780 [bacterium]